MPGWEETCVTLIPYVNVRSLTWDVTVVCLTIDLAVQGPGSVAEMAASRKEAKYAALQTHHYIFLLIAVEPLDPINESACTCLDDMSWRISVLSGNDRVHRAFVFILAYYGCYLMIQCRFVARRFFPLMTTQISVHSKNFFLFL